MKRKIKILLEDDNEILGNGLGHPTHRQYLPTKKYVEILNKFSIKGTFYIDMAHYLFLQKHKDYRDFAFQAQTIKETIKLLAKNKMDVQVHLHSQWVGAKIENNHVFVTDKWNIGMLSSEDQELLFNEAYDVLSEILNELNIEPNLNSYKAGSWGLQPFNNLYDVFVNKGIKLVLGPIKGLKVENLDVDYTNLHSDSKPYFASKDDINKVDDKKNIVVIPMTPTYLNWPDFLRYIFEIKFLSFFKNNNDLDKYDVPNSINQMNPLSGKDKLNFGFKPFKTHLKINAQKYWYLKNTFKRAYKKIKASNSEYKLMVIETHTKDFIDTFADIEKFFSYVKNKYRDVEFLTSSQIVEDLSSNKLVPLDE
jgi:hypothetical protein